MSRDKCHDPTKSLAVNYFSKTRRTEGEFVISQSQSPSPAQPEVRLPTATERSFFDQAELYAKFDSALNLLGIGSQPPNGKALMESPQLLYKEQDFEVDSVEVVGDCHR